MLFYRPKPLYPFLSSAILPFLFFLSIGWYCVTLLGVTGVFGLIGGRSFSRSLALPTTFNNNNTNNNNNNKII